MTAVASVGGSQNPEVIALTQKVVQLVMASAARASVVERGVTGMRLPQDPQSLEHVFAPMLRGSGTRPRQLRQAFGRSGVLPGIDFRGPRSVIEQAVANGDLDSVKLSPATVAQLRPGLSSEEIADIVARILRFRRPAPGGGGSTTTPPAARVAKELHLKLKRVRCVQRVGWEATDWDGKDVILYGGLGFDSTLDPDSPPSPDSPSTAHFRKVPQSSAGTFDDDGDVRNFNPDKTFCKWDLSASGPWPRGFFGTIAFAEKDSGDEFADLLESIWKLVTPEVIALVTSIVAGALAGASVGAATAALAGALGGVVIGGLIGLIVGVVSDTLRDDILETADTPVPWMLSSASEPMPGGGDTSDVYTAEYVRPGSTGVYTLDYYWQLVY